MSWIVTSEIFELLGQKLERLESPSLRLEKMFFLKKKQDNKERQIDAVVDCHNAHAVFPVIGFADIPEAESFIMRLGGRLLVDHSGGVLENTGLSLHRHFGCPYIPGSALKGIARHQAWCAWREAADNTEEKRLAALRLAVIFGYPAGDPVQVDKKPNRRTRLDETDFLNNYLRHEYPRFFSENGLLATCAGTVCFLPALPVATDKNMPRLARDITTSHHSDYYRGKQKKAWDNEQPNVLPFPAVEQGAVFEFTVHPVARERAVLGIVKNELPQDFSPLEFGLSCLRQGLQEHGVGAKTGAGYGWFEEAPEIENYIEAKRKAALKAEEQRKYREEERKQERERLAKMSPEERRTEELGSLSDDDFKGRLKEIKNQDEDEQRAMLLAVKKHKIHIWMSDKKGKKKAADRAEIMRDLARQYGEELP